RIDGIDTGSPVALADEIIVRNKPLARTIHRSGRLKLYNKHFDRCNFHGWSSHRGFELCSTSIRQLNVRSSSGASSSKPVFDASQGRWQASGMQECGSKETASPHEGINNTNKENKPLV